MHSSTLFLVALASLMVSFTSAKVAAEEHAVRVTGIRQGNNAVHFNMRRNMGKRGNKASVQADPYVSPAYSQSGSNAGGLTNGITGGILGGGGGGAAGSLPIVGDLV